MQGHLRREFTLWSAFSLAFAYISPIVAVYGVFALAVILVGPGFWLAIPVALAGQYLVASSLGEVASKYPFEGSLYQWAGRLLGPRYGWMTGWVYTWTVLIAMATVAIGAASFWGAAFGLDLSNRWSLILVATIIVALCTVANSIGRKPLRIMIILSIIAEIVGSIGLGFVLIVFYNINPFSVIWENGVSGTGLTAGAFALAVALAGWSFLGFESAGAIAEEVEQPERNVPKALRYSLLAIGAIVLFSTYSLLAAMPDIPAVMAGEVADPISETLTVHLGSTVTTAAEVLFAIGFTACCLGLQTGISRVLFAFARDDALPASKWLQKLSVHQGVPTNAIIATLPPVIILFLLSGSNVYSVLVSYTIGGWYLTFVLVLVAACIVRFRGSWTPGAYSLGRWSMPVLLIATVWAFLEMINISWPREILSGPDWYLQWAVVIALALILVVGLIVLAWVGPRMRFGVLDMTDPVVVAEAAELDENEGRS